METTLSLNQLGDTRQYPAARALYRLAQIPDFGEVTSWSSWLFTDHAAELNTAEIVGISSLNMTLMYLSLFIGALTLAIGRTTLLQGVVHLIIFFEFLFLSLVP